MKKEKKILSKPNKNFRVLQMGKFYPVKGGVEHVMILLSQGLKKKKIKVDVLTVNDLPSPLNISGVFYENGLRLFLAKRLFSLFSVKFSIALLFLARRIIRHYDILHIHHPDPMAALALFLAFPSKKQKIFLHYHSDIVRQKLLMPLYSPLQSWLLKRANQIVVTSPPYLESSVYLQKYKHKCEILPIGIFPLKHKPKLVQEIRQKFQGKKIVLSIGRLIYYKGYEYLVYSAKDLPADYVILIGGDGPLAPSLQSIIEKEKLKEKVFLLGRIHPSELGSYYFAADVFCLPSVERSEAFGIAQIEAMSFGKPIVTTQIPGSGVSWVNADGETGFNVPVRNPQKLAWAIKTILENKALYKKFSKNAKKRFQELFTLEKMVFDTIKIYEKLLSK